MRPVLVWSPAPELTARVGAQVFDRSPPRDTGSALEGRTAAASRMIVLRWLGFPALLVPIAFLVLAALDRWTFSVFLLLCAVIAALATFLVGLCAHGHDYRRRSLLHRARFAGAALAGTFLYAVVLFPLWKAIPADRSSESWITQLVVLLGSASIVLVPAVIVAVPREDQFATLSKPLNRHADTAGAAVFVTIAVVAIVGPGTLNTTIMRGLGIGGLQNMTLAMNAEQRSALESFGIDCEPNPEASVCLVSDVTVHWAKGERYLIEFPGRPSSGVGTISADESAGGHVVEIPAAAITLLARPADPEIAKAFATSHTDVSTAVHR